ncbi:MAG: hypothetical protein EOO38_02260 [Cytophagaceae bacterium]|nr:MAG: hypothetical protein EOO38_02260 [Cytophagaceae bacterium]
MWHPVSKVTLTSAMLSPPVVRGTHGYASTEIVTDGNVDKQTPPPPYTEGAYWSHQEAVSGQETATSLSREQISPPDINMQSAARVPDYIDYQKFEKKLSPALQSSTAKKHNAGDAVSQEPKPTAADLIRSEKKIPPKIVQGRFARTTKNKASNTAANVKRKYTREQIFQSNAHNRKRVDPATGNAALAGEAATISAISFYMRAMVDPLTGHAATPHTVGAISRSKYRHSRPVNPDTGDSVSAEFKGAITINAYRKRKAVQMKKLASE